MSIHDNSSFNANLKAKISASLRVPNQKKILSELDQLGITEKENCEKKRERKAQCQRERRKSMKEREALEKGSLSQSRSEPKEIEGAKLESQQEFQLKQDKKDRACKKNNLAHKGNVPWNKGKTLSEENKVSFTPFTYFHTM